MFNNPFKKPYKQIDFVNWSNACYNLAVLSIAGCPVVMVSSDYSLELKILYLFCLLIAFLICSYSGRKLSHFIENHNEE